MTTYLIENLRWPGLHYQNERQEADDIDTAIAQFLEPRVSPAQIAGLRMLPIDADDIRVPYDCNVVHRVDDDGARHLVAAFTIPGGEWP